jgi:hypothetical protein
MTEEPKATPKAPKYDQVTTLFADGLFGASVISGTVRLDLFGLFAEHGRAEGGANAPVPMVVGRLVLPADRLQAFVQGLTEITQRLIAEKAAKP